MVFLGYFLGQFYSYCFFVVEFFRVFFGYFLVLLDILGYSHQGWQYISVHVLFLRSRTGPKIVDNHGLHRLLQ